MDPPCQPHRLHDRLLHRLCVCPVPAPGRDASGKDAKPPRRRCLKLQPRHDLPRAQVLHFHLLGHRISRTLLDLFGLFPRRGHLWLRIHSGNKGKDPQRN